MKKKDEISRIKDVAFTSLFLALSALFVIFQFPFYSFLSIDISALFILLSFSYISFRHTLVVGIFSPVFLFLIGGNIISVSTIIAFNLLLIFFHKILFLNNNLFSKLFSTFWIIIFVSLIMTGLNIILFTPAWYGFDYEIIFENLYKFFIIILPFNIIKLTIVYTLYFLTDKFVKSIEI